MLMGPVIMILMVLMPMIVSVMVRVIVIVIVRMVVVTCGRHVTAAEPAVKKEGEQRDIGKNAYPHQPSSPGGLRRRRPVLTHLNHRAGRMSLRVGDVKAPRAGPIRQEDGAAQAIGAPLLKRRRRVPGGKHPHRGKCDRLAAAEPELDRNAARRQRPIDDDVAGAVRGRRADRAEGEQTDEQGRSDIHR
jgi:hypothetical protein